MAGPLGGDAGAQIPPPTLRFPSRSSNPPIVAPSPPKRSPAGGFVVTGAGAFIPPATDPPAALDDAPPVDPATRLRTASIAADAFSRNFEFEHVSGFAASRNAPFASGCSANASANLAPPAAPAPAAASTQHAALYPSCHVPPGAIAPRSVFASARASPSALSPSHARVNASKTSAGGASFTPPRAHASSTRRCSSEPASTKGAAVSALRRACVGEGGEGETIEGGGGDGAARVSRVSRVSRSWDAKSETASGVEDGERSGTTNARLGGGSRRWAVPPHVPVVLLSLGAPSDASPMMGTAAGAASVDANAGR